MIRPLFGTFVGYKNKKIYCRCVVGMKPS